MNSRPNTYQNKAMTDIKVITPVSPNTPASSALDWKPKLGKETKGLLESKSIPENEKQSILNSAIAILGQGINPQHSGKRGDATGLVIGHVQSGKTMSFVTVSALAKDNGFPMVIAITGTSTFLHNQSTNRFKQDLRIATAEDYRRWQPKDNPEPNSETISDCTDYIEGWREDKNNSPAVLITVMKHQRHLNNVAKLLKDMPVSNFPILIIDDEADQASLNTRPGDISASEVYKSIKALRAAASRHTFLQYTATPQAPLLINTFDRLSPDYFHLLKPGAAYIGGKDFFIDNRESLIENIYEKEIDESQDADSPPPSLHKALRIYLLGVAAGLLDQKHGRPTAGNRSMLVHPSIRQISHEQFHTWIRMAIDHWKGILLSISLSLPGLSMILRGFSGQHIRLRPRTPRMNSLGLFCGISKCRGEYLLCST